MSATPPSIEVVLFDVGGVLIELGGVTPMLDSLGYRMPTEDLWRKWLHSPGARDFETGRIEAREFATRMIEELQLQITHERFLEGFAGWPTGLFPGIVEVLERIPDQYVRAVLSNSNAVHWPQVEIDLGSLVHHQFVSHRTGHIKPDEAAFLHVSETLHCRPEAILFLDDNLLNVEAARRTGMQAFVARGTREVEQVLLEAKVIERSES